MKTSINEATIINLDHGSRYMYVTYLMPLLYAYTTPADSKVAYHWEPKIFDPYPLSHILPTLEYAVYVINQGS